MLRKTLAFLLTLAMMGIILPLATMATGVIALKSVNATTKVISIDLDGVTPLYALSAESFAGKIELFKFTSNGIVEAVTDFTAVEAGGNYAEGNTIIITPTGGLEAGKLYKVVLKAGIADNAPTPAMITQDINTVWFYVTVIYSDNFNVTKDGNNAPIYPYYIHSTGAMASYNWNMAYGVGGTPVVGFNGIYDGNYTPSTNTKMTFRNNSRFASLNTTGLSAAKYASDYTVEYTYGLAKSSSDDHRLRMRSIVTTDNVTTYSNGYGFGLKKAYSYTGLTGTAFVQNKTTDISTIPYTFKSTNVAVRASTIGNKLQYFVDNDKVFDVTDSGITAAGTIGFNDGCTWNLAPFPTVDDLIMTKFTSVGATIPVMQIEYFNADTTAITMDYFCKINDPSIAEKILLTKNGVEESAFDVAVNDDVLTIKPIGGLVIGAQYKITIASGVKGTIATQAESFVKNFIVKKGVEDNFDDEAIGISKWKAYTGISYDSTNKRMNLATTATQDSIYRTAGTDGAPFSMYSTAFDLCIGTATDFKGINFYSNANHNSTFNYLNKYYIVINSDGSLELRIRDTTKNPAEPPLPLARGNITIQDNKVYKIRFAVQGSQARLFVDDVKVLESNQATLKNIGVLGFLTKAGNICGIDNIMVSYMTTAEPNLPLIIDSLSINDFNSATPVATVGVRNFDDSAKDFVLIVAMYDASGKMIGVTTGTKNILANKEIAYSVNLINTGVIDHAKAFLWSTTDNVKPLSSAFTVRKN